MRTLCVEGWRFLHHSYAMINQWQLLSLLKRQDISLSVRDVPYYRSDWQPIQGLFTEEQEAQLAFIPEHVPDNLSDATLRIAAPLDFSLQPNGRTIVFATSETRRVRDHHFRSSVDIRRLSQSETFVVVTPSRWSREGFLRLGLRADQVIVVPHGIDPGIFRRSDRVRKSARQTFGVSGFTFANASSMTTNKGIDLLLRAFAVVAKKHPDAHLLLKGVDDLYGSRELLDRYLTDLPREVINRFADRILYFGDTISTRKMSEFYQAADMYVSPYRAEGFNLPVLEACACGTPVICTSGGSTDDFMNEHFTRFINSSIRSVTHEDAAQSDVLEPDLDHLIQLMLQAVEDDTWRDEAARAGARHAATYFNWDSVVEKLLEAIFGVHGMGTEEGAPIVRR